MKYIIKSLKNIYSGGNITIYYGELMDGHFFLADDGNWAATILNALDEEENENGDLPMFYPDWQEEHLVEYVEEGQGLFEFFLQIFEFIKKNWKDKTKVLDGWICDKQADEFISYMLEHKDGLFFWDQPKKEDLAEKKIAELEDLSAAVNECVFDEDGKPTESWDMRFTIGFLSPADGVYKNVDMYICPETFEMFENAIKDLKDLVPDYYN